MKIAVFPGSFDPVTKGHLDLIKRASRLFDRLIVLVGTNLRKNYLFSLAERVRLIEGNVCQLQNVKVMAEHGLTVKQMRKLHSLIIIRGLRNNNDLDYEKRIAFINHHLDPQVETIFLLARSKYECISSQVIKEAFYFGGNISSFVPQNVMQQLKEKRRDGQE